jgi:ankyrin repeat protein
MSPKKAKAPIRDKKDMEKLWDAAKNGHAKVLSVLQLGDSRLDEREDDGSGWTLLHNAAANGHKDVVSLLLSRNAEANSWSCSGGTPLTLAAKNGDLEVVQMLVAHVRKQGKKSGRASRGVGGLFTRGCRLSSRAIRSGQDRMTRRVSMLARRGSVCLRR